MSIEKSIRVNKLLDIYGNLLTKKQFTIMQNYYAYDYSLAEIGEILGISRQAVNDAIKQSIEALEEYEVKLKFLAKINAVKTITKDNQSEIINKVLNILED